MCASVCARTVRHAWTARHTLTPFGWGSVASAWHQHTEPQRLSSCDPPPVVCIEVRPWPAAPGPPWKCGGVSVVLPCQLHGTSSTSHVAPCVVGVVGQPYPVVLIAARRPPWLTQFGDSPAYVCLCVTPNILELTISVRCHALSLYSSARAVLGSVAFSAFLGVLCVRACVCICVCV